MNPKSDTAIGYFVMGKYTSIAWCALESEACKLVKELTMRGIYCYIERDMI